MPFLLNVGKKIAHDSIRKHDLMAITDKTTQTVLRTTPCLASVSCMNAVFLSLAILLLSSCASQTSTARLSVKMVELDKNQKYESVYLLQPGDQIEIFVYRHPELSRHLSIRPDGHISLPLIEHDVLASGKSARDLASELEAILVQRILRPEVSVMVENSQEPVVYVVGEVGLPHSVTLRQAKTVAQALAQSGPLPKTAKLANVSVLRVSSDGYLQAYSVEPGSASQPEIYMALNTIRLQPNDLIVVPESNRGQFMRAIQDINSILNPYLQLRLLQNLAK